MQLLKNVMNSVTLTKGKAAAPLQIDDSISKMNKEENFSKTRNLNNDSLQSANFNEERELVSNNKLNTINEQIIIVNKKDYQRTLEPHKSKKPLPPILSNTGQTSKTSFKKIDSSLNEKLPNIKSGNNIFIWFIIFSCHFQTLCFHLHKNLFCHNPSQNLWVIIELQW